MEEPRIRLRPVCVASHLHRHEILKCLPCDLIVIGKPAGVGAE